ncbi:MAG TPA: hemolysin family protein [Cyclobacteriaceae bacterium]|nr:hemolysin family protein [Cyclobacteriaceae bacterium]
MMEHQFLITALFSLLALVLFSGLEVAFIAGNRLHIELQSKLGTLNGRILSNLINKPSQFVGTTLIGSTISLVVFGVAMAYLFEPIILSSLPEGLDNPGSVLVVQVLLSTFVVLIAAEYVPKSIFRRNPHMLLSFLAVPFLFVYYLMYPIVWVVRGISKWVVSHIFRLEYGDDKPVFKITDLNTFIQQNLTVDRSEAQVEIDAEIFENAVGFKTIRVRDCMVPRTEIVAVEIDEAISALSDVFIESGHSKIIVYKDNIDEVVGYCHHLELFKKPKAIRDILTPIIIVPDSALANDLLVQFISERKSLALVVDEFGGTGGIVSMEDVIEQIFGEIEDEYDSDDLLEQKISDQEFLLSARHEIDYLNDKYDWNLPTGEYETLSGLILSRTEEIPQKGESITIGPYIFTVVTKLDYRIDTVKLKINSSTI